MDNFTKIKVFNNKIEAEIAKSFLISNGIKAIIISDDVGSMYPSTQNIAGVNLYVRKKDFDKAMEMLVD